jgi:hypothetical protein
MPILFDSDPLTGRQQFYSYDPDKDEHKITTVQDVSGFLAHMKAKRDATPEFGRAEEFAHYASIPPIVITELQAKGIDVFNKHQTKELLKEINTNYQFLKATTKYHA